MLTLNDLKPRVVDVQIIMGKLPPKEEGGLPEDDVRIVSMRVPSWIEWMEMGMAVSQPVREKVETYKGGKKTYVDEDDAAWERKLADAGNKRQMRRLAFALIEAGNFPELKDADVDEQVAAIGGMDAGILQALMKQLNSLVQFTAGRIVDSAARFREGTVSENGNADMLPESVEVSDVE